MPKFLYLKLKKIKMEKGIRTAKIIYRNVFRRKANQVWKEKTDSFLKNDYYTKDIIIKVKVDRD